MRANERDELLLPFCAHGSDFGKPGRDDAQRSYARVECFSCSGEHSRARQADDGEIDRLADRSDVGVRAHTRDRRRRAVDREADAAKLGTEDVP